jgi:hypothetical protein
MYIERPFSRRCLNRQFNAKLDGPLMSMGASGSIGGILTFGSNKGRNFVRQLVIPSNPRSPAQTGVRSMMKWVGQEWAQLSAPQQATWEARAAQTNISPFNAFSSKNMDNWSNGKGGQREDPAETAIATALPTGIADAVTERRATITWTDPATAGGFGIIYYQSPTTGFTPGRDNAVAVIDLGVQQFITPTLPPGTYFYRLTSFNIEAEITTPAATEGSFVIA